MNFKVLKRQIGQNILREVEFKEIGEKGILTHEETGREATITLNLMDLYDLILKGEEGIKGIKKNISNSNLRSVLNDYFNLSLNQAIRNNDTERRQQIEEKAKNGEKVRIL